MSLITVQSLANGCFRSQTSRSREGWAKAFCSVCSCLSLKSVTAWLHDCMIFKIQKPTWRSVNQSWPSLIETQWRVPFFNLPEYFWSFLLTLFDPSWLYGCFSFHWELCSSFLLLQAAKQPKSSQRDGFNGHHHSDQTNLHWFLKLYNYERNDSIVFNKAQIMFQLHKVISHCWC